MKESCIFMFRTLLSFCHLVGEMNSSGKKNDNSPDLHASLAGLNKVFCITFLNILHLYSGLNFNF